MVGTRLRTARCRDIRSDVENGEGTDSTIGAGHGCSISAPAPITISSGYNMDSFTNAIWLILVIASSVVSIVGSILSGELGLRLYALLSSVSLGV